MSSLEANSTRTHKKALVSIVLPTAAVHFQSYSLWSQLGTYLLGALQSQKCK